MLDEIDELIAAEMMAPAIAVRGLRRAVRFEKTVPAFGKLLEKSRVTMTGDEPNRLRAEKFPETFCGR